MMNKVPFNGAGYLDVGALCPHILPYTWIWGGRGTGKTYGFLEYVRYTNPCKFLLLRRTQKQIDLLRKPMYNPFKAIDANHADRYTAVSRDGDTGLFYDSRLEDGRLVPQGSPIGYALALSTVHNVRGIDLSDVDVVIYDEYIPEPHERPIRYEYEAFLNAMETIGRNRELQGKRPVQFVGLSNANSLGNPYFLGLGVIRRVDKMLKSGTEIWADPGRGLMLINITASPISQAKARTSLYKLAGDGEFSAMSLGNEFSMDVCSRQGSFPLGELRPLVSVGELCIYEHKRNKTLYCCDHHSGSPDRYNPDDTNLKRFRRDYGWLWTEYMDNNIIFQDILCEILFNKYLT